MTHALPYVYKLTHKITGQFYYGYRCANKRPAYEDLPIYRTSSKAVHEIGFDNFDWVILKEFSDKEDAYMFEQKLIEENFKDALCLNAHYTKEGKGKFRSDGPVTVEHRTKISQAARGRKYEGEAKLKAYASKIGVPLKEEHKKNLSIAAKNRAEVACPHCSKTSRNAALMKRHHFDNCKFKSFSQ